MRKRGRRRDFFGGRRERKRRMGQNGVKGARKNGESQRASWASCPSRPLFGLRCALALGPFFGESPHVEEEEEAACAQDDRKMGENGGKEENGECSRGSDLSL